MADYTARDLDVSNSPWSLATGINDAGAIVGATGSSPPRFPWAFLWRDGTMFALGVDRMGTWEMIGVDYPLAEDINNAEQVAITGQNNDANSFAFRWENGTIQDILSFNSRFIEARAINSAGSVVGVSGVMTNEWEPLPPIGFVWNGWMGGLPPLPGHERSEALDINDAGSIVGGSSGPSWCAPPPESGRCAGRAVMWRGGTVIDLGTLGGTAAIATGINDRDQVVGWSTTAGNAAAHAFIRDNGVMTDLGTLGGNSYAEDINNQGRVVGVSYLTPNVYHAVVWNRGQIRDLGTLGGANSEARAVNASGVIVGVSDLPGNTAYHATVWTPGTTVLPNNLNVLPSDPANRIPCHNPDYMIRVAVLTRGRFDAASIDPGRLSFAGGYATYEGWDSFEIAHYKDVDGDGDLDLLVNVPFISTNLNCSSTQFVVTGMLPSGQPIMMMDRVQMVK